MDPLVVFQQVSWDDLIRYLHREACKINRDVDQDVRYMNYSMYCEQTVEGLYVDGVMAGFARWDRRNGHLSNLYVSPEYRGRGLGKRFINDRPIRTLYVVPHNHQAKRLYLNLGFQFERSSVATREFMTRAA